MILKVACKILDPRLGTQWPLPQYETDQAAGMDLRACLEETSVLAAGETRLISAGLAIHIQSPNQAALILPRSGLGHRDGIVLGNGIGLIDADYQGELKISLWNRSQKPYAIVPGTRIAQLLFLPISRIQWQIMEAFEPSVRGSGGFGHTGHM